MTHKQLKESVNQAFTQLEEEVTYVTVTTSFDSEDDETESTSESTVNAIIQVMGLEDSQEAGGELSVGDAIGYFRESTTVNEGDRIKHNGETYKIDRVLPEYAGSKVFTMAFLQRVH